MRKIKGWLVVCIIAVGLSGCKTTLYCTRAAPKYPDTFLCSDKGENFMLPLVLDRLRARNVPKDWNRVRIIFFPYYPIKGISFYPFGYAMRDYTGKYNDGTLIRGKLD